MLGPRSCPWRPRACSEVHVCEAEASSRSGRRRAEWAELRERSRIGALPRLILSADTAWVTDGCQARASVLGLLSEPTRQHRIPLGNAV